MIPKRRVEGNGVCVHVNRITALPDLETKNNWRDPNSSSPVNRRHEVVGSGFGVFLDISYP
jgi:hypothetical protein